MLNDVFLFGADRIVLNVGEWCLSNGISCTVMTTEGQAKRPLSDNSPFDELARIYDIKLVVADSLRQLNELGINTNPNESFCISIGAPWFFTDQFLRTFGCTIYNLHGTRLPKQRGGNLFSWQILMGIRVGMCGLHELTERIDDGPVIRYEEFIYPAHCRKPIDYVQHYQEKNTEFLIRLLTDLKSGTVQFRQTDQPEYLSSYLPRLSADVNGWIDWSWDTKEIERFVCAFDEPYPGARTKHRGRVVVVKDVYAQSSDGSTHPFQSGLVYRNNGKWLSVSVPGGEVLICSVTDLTGGNVLPTIKPGDRFYTTPDDLNSGKTRIVKTDAGLVPQRDF